MVVRMVVGAAAASERQSVMPTNRLQFLMAVAAVVVLALPAITHAGDAPIFVVGNWGIGEIDSRIMFYLGRNRCLDTPIPAPPHGPRWDVVYKGLPFVVLGGVAVWL